MHKGEKNDSMERSEYGKYFTRAEAKVRER